MAFRGSRVGIEWPGLAALRVQSQKGEECICGGLRRLMPSL